MNPYAQSSVRPYSSTDPIGLQITYSDSATLPLSQAEIEIALRATLNTADDAYILRNIKSAVRESERATNRSYITKAITCYWQIAYNYVVLPISPYVSITSVTKIDSDNTETAVSSSDYDVYGIDNVVVRFTTPINQQLKIVYTAGYGAADTNMPSWVQDAVTARVMYKYAKQPVEMLQFKDRYKTAEAQNIKFYNGRGYYQGNDSIITL